MLHAVLGEVSVAIYEFDGARALIMQYGAVPRGVRALVRIQAACVYGDTLLAADCDCRDQLDDTFRLFLDYGSGMLIYLLEEDSPNLVAKARAYELQEREGIDGVEALQRLGLEMSTSGFVIAIDVLKGLGVSRISLLTNNGGKTSALLDGGLDVVRQPLPARITENNLRHLRAKQTNLGHELGLPVPREGGPTAHRCFVVGAAVMDHVFEMKANPQLGRSRQATEYQRRPGGKGLNQAIALSRLGAEVSLLTIRGHDDDGDKIATILAAENVRGCFARANGDEQTPQTAILQPLSTGLASYIGWLGPQNRGLHQQSIDERAKDIRACHALLITFEASEDTITRSIKHAKGDALVVLSASPAAERPYHFKTETLQMADVLIGSPDEMHALLPGKDAATLKVADFEAVARRIAELCGVTVIITDFSPVANGRSAGRVFAIGPFIQAVRVRAPQVRGTESLAATVGMADVFCAAFTLSALELGEVQQVPHEPGMWRAETSPLANRTNLLDVLISAVGPSAWVARSSGGYDSFPRTGPSLEEWCRKHPSVPERGNWGATQRTRRPRISQHERPSGE
ncbi:PfkB family carbohydrate kinase [Paractinoplanes toevensis]|uniref:PfkB family carbohydrate kinase n=1 Tax=Paractinoplanes toevensis TaxID=571911 RepID=UPI001BB3BF4D|nr:PfkB family carbohydrate kinase [Actinoplanes toevensis]